MRDQELKDLWEAYQQINQLDEVKTATSIQNDRIPDFETEKKAKQVPGLRVNKPSSPMEEEVDLFDYLLEYLVAEGYADTNKAALAIMANMSEEWKKSIVEQLTPLGVKAAGAVDDQRRGSTMAKDLKDTGDALKKVRPYPNGFPAVKGV